jgi:hypothetical protein
MNIPTVIYPYFEECQDFTLDQYWKDIFFSCACGTFPKGCRFDPNTHTLYTRVQVTNTKTKGEAIYLPQKSEEIYLILLDVFKNKFGMFSSKDLQIKKDELEEIQEQQRINMDCEWKKLKPRAIKDFLISNYVSDLQTKYNLTSKEARLLFTNIGVWMQLKKITSDDIDYQNHSILNIRGIEFDEQTRVWSNTNTAKFNGKSDKINKPQKFDQALDKFARDYKYRRSKI